MYLFKFIFFFKFNNVDRLVFKSFYVLFSRGHLGDLDLKAML